MNVRCIFLVVVLFAFIVVDEIYHKYYLYIKT